MLTEIAFEISLRNSFSKQQASVGLASVALHHAVIFRSHDMHGFALLRSCICIHVAVSILHAIHLVVAFFMVCVVFCVFLICV